MRHCNEAINVSGMLFVLLSMTAFAASNGFAQATNPYHTYRTSFGGHSSDAGGPLPDVMQGSWTTSQPTDDNLMLTGGHSANSCQDFACDEWMMDGCDSDCLGGDFKDEPCFRLSEFNIYPTGSFLDDQSATYVEFEFATKTQLGFLEMENRTVLNVADLPGTISLGPTNPFGAGPNSTGVRASGFGDVLSGFFFSLSDHEANWHLGIGPVITFPSASDPILGSSQYTVGPGAHFSADLGKLTAGFFVWQSWEFTSFESGKRVNQLFGKPFFLYELTEEWNLIYIPLGLSHSWKAKEGEDWTVPLGGGIRRLIDFGEHKVGLQCQVFDYVARKPKDPKWEIRFTIEFLLDEE